MLETFFHDLENLIAGKDAFQLRCQLWMASKLTAEENSVSARACLQAGSRADRHALTARHALVEVDHRTFLILAQIDSMLSANGYARATLAARFLRRLGPHRTDEAYVAYLRPRARVRAIRKRNTEFVVHFQRALDAALQEITEPFAGYHRFQILDQGVIDQGAVWATIGPEARLDLIAFDLLIHVGQESLLTGSHVFQGHLVASHAPGLFFDALSHAAPNKERDPGNSFLSLTGPLHTVTSVCAPATTSMRQSFRRLEFVLTASSV